MMEKDTLHALRLRQAELETQNAELRRRQAQLETDRARYLDLYEQAPVGYLTVSRAGLVLEANLTAARMLEVPRAALIGQPLSRFIHKEDADIYGRQCQRLFETGEPADSELRIVKKSATAFWAHLDATPVKNHGHPPASRIIISDITALKRYEDLLRIKNLVFDESLAAISIADLDGRLTEVNGAFLRVWGYAGKDDVIGKPIAHFVDDVAMPAAILAALDTTGYWEGNYVAKRGDGTTFIANGLATVIREKNGNVIGYQSSVTDVTARTRDETYRGMGSMILQILNQSSNLQDTLPHVVAELKTRAGVDAVGLRLHDDNDVPYFAQTGFPEEFLQRENTLTARAADGNVCRDQNGNVILECTCGLVLAGKTDSVNPLFTPWGSFWTNDARPLLDLAPEQDPRVHPRNACIHQGYASMALVPVRDKDRILGLLQLNGRRKGCFTREAIERLEEIAAYIGSGLMRREAEEEKTKFAVQKTKLLKAESLGRMAGAIAHNFNNQLTVVMGNLELAMRKLPRDEETAAFLGSALQGARQAAGVSTAMLTYLGQTPGVHLGRLDLAGICRELLPGLCRGMPRHIGLRTDLPDPGPSIFADAHQFRQILANLFTNAREAISAGGGTIRLAVKTVSRADIPDSNRFPFEWRPQADNYACLEIADTGCGIAVTDMEKLFDPFFSTKFAGRGLGLPVVMGLLHGSDSGVTVESTPGHGTIFRVYVTLAPQDGTPKPAPAFPAPKTDAGVMMARQAQTGTVLVVDDEPAIREVSTFILRHFGFTVLAAEDGVAAVEIFRLQPDEIRCVLCDLSMPRMDGWATLTALRALRPDLPVILASGYDVAQVMAGDHPELPQAFIGKPYTMAELRATIEKVLG